MPRIFRRSAHESGKVVSRAHRPPLPPLVVLRYVWTGSYRPSQNDDVTVQRCTSKADTQLVRK